MKYLFGFIISFVLVYIFYLITVILQKNKIERFKKSNQVMYFVKRYKWDLEKIDLNKFINVISLTNSFIVALAFTTTYLVDNIYLGMLLGLCVLIPLMLILYSIIGNKFKEEGKVCTTQKK